MSFPSLPVVSRTSAFVAGVAFAVLVFLLGDLKARRVIPYDADSPELFPIVMVFFFVSVLFFVIDVRSFAPKELRTKNPAVYFPTNREGVSFMLSGWGRAIVWFFGATVGGAALSLISYLT